MTRITTAVLVVLVLANGAASVMATSGLSEDLGVELNPGIDKQMDNVTSTMKDGFDPNTGAIESFVLLATGFGGLFKTVIQGMWAAPTMLINLGFPEYIVTVFFAPAYVIATLELGAVVVGRRTV